MCNTIHLTLLRILTYNQSNEILNRVPDADIICSLIHYYGLCCARSTTKHINLYHVHVHVWKCIKFALLSRCCVARSVIVHALPFSWCLHANHRPAYYARKIKRIINHLHPTMRSRMCVDTPLYLCICISLSIIVQWNWHSRQADNPNTFTRTRTRETTSLRA